MRMNSNKIRAPSSSSSSSKLVRLLGLTVVAPSVLFLLLLFSSSPKYYSSSRSAEENDAAAESSASRSSLYLQSRSKPMVRVVPPLRSRLDLAALVESEGFTTGVELGVYRAEFAKHNLINWPSCKRYLLVDIWGPLENYDDSSNIKEEHREYIFNRAMAKTKEVWPDRVEVCRGLTTDCAKNYSNEKFDFVYVDARHDYKGVLVDLHDWWPLVRDGGIMAGHDFVTNDEGPMQTKQNWTINYDGTVDARGRAVRGAVIEFFNDETHPERYRQIYTTYKDHAWPTWIVRK